MNRNSENTLTPGNDDLIKVGPGTPIGVILSPFQVNILSDSVNLHEPCISIEGDKGRSYKSTHISC